MYVEKIFAFEFFDNTRTIINSLFEYYMSMVVRDSFLVYLEYWSRVDENVRRPEVPVNYVQFSEASQSPSDLSEKISNL